ncbi:MAG: MaoC family dehydratase [Nitrososphaerales archaeon]
MTLFYEDFEIGRQFESRARRVSNSDIQRFAEVTGDLNRLHVDEEYAKSTIFRRPIAHGMFTLSLALGLWYSLDLTRESMIAFMGITDVSFQAPVYADDMIHLSSTVASRRESRSRPAAGLVTFRDEMINSRNEIVMISERTLLLRKKGNPA